MLFFLLEPKLGKFQIISLPLSKNRSINAENNAANFESALTKPSLKWGGKTL